ncbi:MAG: 6-bladed beta-propeller [Ignavibacteriales bacterium]|nr:6-bladed beta-propeller [Ignavibacteriales bacterium]
MLNVHGCRWIKPDHARAPEEFGELVESIRKVSLQLPDSLRCSRDMRVRTDAKGRVYVALVPDYLIGVFDTLGTLIKLVGKQGFGPGELRKIQDFRVLGDGQIYIMDALTDEISLFDLDKGWISTFQSATKYTMTFDIVRDRVVHFRRALGEKQSSHLVVSPLGTASEIKNPNEGYLPSGPESIRNEMLVSQALATNLEGVTVLAFVSAKVIFLLSGSDLSEIDIDPTSYKISETKTLRKRYRDERVRGLMDEVFNNSRVSSLGFVTAEHVMVSFASGRHEETKFYVQLYCLSTGTSISRAYEVSSPIIYLGNYTFASWTRPTRELDATLSKSYEMTLYRFRSRHQ